MSITKVAVLLEPKLLRSVSEQLRNGVAVAVALSHATILEESQRTKEELLRQNEALVIARQEAETAIKARNDFLAVMNHEMRTVSQACPLSGSLVI